MVANQAALPPLRPRCTGELLECEKAGHGLYGVASRTSFFYHQLVVLACTYVVLACTTKTTNANGFEHNFKEQSVQYVRLDPIVWNICNIWNNLTFDQVTYSCSTVVLVYPPYTVTDGLSSSSP